MFRPEEATSQLTCETAREVAKSKEERMLRSTKLVSGLVLVSMLLGMLAACAAPQQGPAPGARPTATRPAATVAPRMAEEPEVEEPMEEGEVVEGGHVTIAMWSPPNNFNAVNTDSIEAQGRRGILVAELGRDAAIAARWCTRMGERYASMAFDVIAAYAARSGARDRDHHLFDNPRLSARVARRRVGLRRRRQSETMQYGTQERKL